jgi:hypothetical protein
MGSQQAAVAGTLTLTAGLLTGAAGFGGHLSPRLSSDNRLAAKITKTFLLT